MRVPSVGCASLIPSPRFLINFTVGVDGGIFILKKNQLLTFDCIQGSL